MLVGFSGLPCVGPAAPSVGEETHDITAPVWEDIYLKIVNKFSNKVAVLHNRSFHY